jgi:hypothetical protein
MAQARLVHPARERRDAEATRWRNRRLGLRLVVLFLTLFLGAIVYIMLFPTVP